MPRKSMRREIALCLVFCAGALLLYSTFGLRNELLGTNPSPNVAQGSTILNGVDGQLRTIPAATNAILNVSSDGTYVNQTYNVKLTIRSRSEDVNASISFKNNSFAASSTPQAVYLQNVFFFQIFVNKSTAIESAAVEILYSDSLILFTERALWVYYYDSALSTWTRIATDVNYATNVASFRLPASINTNSIELALVGQETRGMEFPPWAWILTLLSLGIIAFMAVGELVYQGYIPVVVGGTDGRVLVAVKRFFGGWGRLFTQLDDRVTGYLDYYENMESPVPLLPPEKRPKAISSLAHINRIGIQEEILAKIEDYMPVKSEPKPVLVAKSEEKNPIETAIFEEKIPVKSAQPEGVSFAPYIPEAVRSKGEVKHTISLPEKIVEVPLKGLPPKVPPEKLPSQAPQESTLIPQDLLQAAPSITAEEITPSSTGPKKAGKKGAKKTAKKTTKKAAQ